MTEHARSNWLLSNDALDRVQHNSKDKTNQSSTGKLSFDRIFFPLLLKLINSTFQYLLQKREFLIHSAGGVVRPIRVVSFLFFPPSFC